MPLHGGDGVRQRHKIDKNGGFFTRYPRCVWFITANEMCERFSFYGLRAILVLYFHNFMGYSEDNSITYYHLFIFLSYLWPVLGGYIADAHLGKYKTILYLSVIYCIGTVILSVTAIQGVTGTPPHWWGFVLGLLLISFGTGGIKPCVSSFGGDQFMGTENDEEDITAFFHIFYFSINTGSFVSILATPLIRNYFSFAAAFALPAVLLTVSILFFWMGRDTYVIGLKDCGIDVED
eukprot:TRINITY_DN19824_c0_g1_i1.p1 TRINITY_DN19824_c0_g1~~TRINITY_DN19824_c0_g1_i1.p1  ORF type:complete len:235 (-),score=47.94 TRINITY_DN19824_c0_g1_i1:25-729(-)